jgi:hypothetical protein
MRSIAYTITFFLVSLFLAGCSYSESFALVNRSTDEIEFSYLLSELTPQEGLFDKWIELYEENGEGYPDYSKDLSVVDLDTAANRIRIIVPSKSVLVFGNISNEHYDSKRRITNGGKSFNLSEIQLQQNGRIVEMSTDDFHKHFRESNGFFSLILK